MSSSFAAAAALPAALPRWRRCQELRRRSATGLILEIDIGERLTGVVAHREARVVHLVERPQRREAASGWHGARLVACMRRAPRADIYYIDAFTIRASDVRDDVPPALGYTLPHCILSGSDLAGADVGLLISSQQ